MSKKNLFCRHAWGSSPNSADAEAVTPDDLRNAIENAYSFGNTQLNPQLLLTDNISNKFLLNISTKFYHFYIYVMTFYVCTS